MSQLKLTADSGGGTVAIKGPASTTGNAALEMTVPSAASGTLDSLNRAGNILQVVSVTKTDTASQSSNTLAAIAGLQPTITPASSSNKILININLKIGSSNDYADANLKLYRSIGGSETEIFSGTDYGSRTAGFWGCQDFHQFGEYYQVPVSSQYLDSPSTTSEITYLIKWQLQRSSTSIYLNRTGDDTNDAGAHRLSSSITLMEVAA